MRVISIGTDRKLFDEGSAVRERAVEYGRLFERLDIIVPTNSKSKISNLKISENITVYPTNSKSKLLYVFDTFRIIRKLIINSKLKIENSVITTQDPFETGLVGIALKLWHGAPLQVQLHTDFNNKYFLLSSPLNFVRFFLAHLVLPYADSVRVVSERVKESIKNFNEKIEVLPINVDSSKQIVVSSKENSGTQNILTVARLEKEKDLETAIRAFNIVNQNHPEVIFTIVGDGKERKNLERLCEILKIKDSVKFVGWQNNLESYYQNADIYISTSLFEGYGMSIVEAAGYGLPLVLSDAGVAGEIFKDKESAFVSKPKEVNGLADSLSKLITDRNLRSQMGSSALISAKYKMISHDEYLNKYKDALEKTANHSIKTSLTARLTQFIKAVFAHHKVLRFILAGGTSATVQLVSLFVFTDFVGLWYIYSSILAFLIALCVSFSLQKLWAFKDKNLHKVHVQFFKYFSIALIGVVFNTLSMYFLVDIIGLWYILAQIMTGVWIAVFNFFMYRKFIFHQ